MISSSRPSLFFPVILAFCVGCFGLMQPSLAQEEAQVSEQTGAQPPADQTTQSPQEPESVPVQVPSPSVTLPTPPLPPPLPESALPESKTPDSPEQQPVIPPKPEFNPPTAEDLHAPGSQTPGNPQFAAASVGMPAVTLNDADPGNPDASKGPGLLGSIFDWANKLRFNAAVRGGYDNNVNTSPTNAQASWFGNLNGAINYRFGTPRLNFSSTLTGGLTYYPQVTISNRNQGVIGLGMAVEYRHSPRLILTFNTSSSFQQQANLSLVGTANQNNANQNASYFYTANSMAANYQCSDILTSITRFSYTANYYLNNSLNNQQGAFSQPDFNQSFRWLVKPTTTAVVDYDSNYIGYAQTGNTTWGNSLSGGLDHIFNPRMFWNWRLGAEFRTYQNINRDGVYIGPYMDNTFSWNFNKNSKFSFLSHLATQPSGQQNVSFTPAFRNGVNYSQGITSKITADLGFFYLLQYYQDSPFGPNGTNIDYYQNNLQGNIALNYAVTRILQLSLGYQYISTICDAVPSQAYNRGISYLQLGAAF